MKSRFFIVLAFLALLPSFANSQNIKPYKEKPIVQTGEHIVKNLKGEVVNYVSYEQAMKNNLVYSPKEDAFYSKEVSEKVTDELKNSKGFYGDQVLNPFKQPDVLNGGEFHLNYYGSGSKGDNVTDYNDYLAMQSGIQADEYDVDGDGISSTASDQQLVYNYVTDQIPYLPAHEDVLKTENEKTNWHEKKSAIDKTDTITYVPGQFECWEFSLQRIINDPGIENISNSGINFNVMDTSMNAKFNGRSYTISTKAMNGQGHAANAILVGDYTSSFTDWYFFEPQTDYRIYPGDPSMDPDSYVNIKRVAYIWSEYLQQYVHASVPLINFDLENGIAISAIPQHPDVVLEKPIIHYNIGGQNPSDITVNVEDALTPDFTGSPGAADWATEFYSDSTNQNPDVWSPGHWNYTILRNHKAVSNENPIIDTTYSSLELSVLIPDYNRPPQEITVQDTTAPWFTYVFGNQIIPFTQHENIPLSLGDDNSGYFNITRTESSTQGIDPTQCDYYNFTKTITDEIKDPSENFTDTTSMVNVVLDQNNWNFFPEDFTTNYSSNLNLDPENTGGWATATNPIGLGVVVNYDQISYQNPDSTKCEHYNFPVENFWTATDTICYNAIDSVQNINVVKPMSIVWTEFPNDTLIGKYDSMHPDDLGWPDGNDTLVPWFEVGKNYWDELIDSTATYMDYHRHWTLEDLCNQSTNDSIQQITRDMTTTVAENKNIESFLGNPFPNPTTGNITIPYFSTNTENIHFKFYNIQGQELENILVEPKQIGNNEFSLDLSEYSTGPYLLNVNNGESVETKKVFVK
ncbi:MAG: T9SS type A sorting domain-containing protein [Bacteroidetes bacterium]|nr:T9SS type A sorting domain-containing protein [Bacteroidota bacterium]MBL7104240.1 T9SS type A sorting domain-containing protein [Bacteroidales bacterium]